MLSVDAIHTYYGESHVLHGVSLRVDRGEGVALLGRNGVGKTTLIRSLIGFTPPRDGAIHFDGRPIHGLPAYEIARRGIGLVPQGRRIFAPLTVLENLVLAARAARAREGPVAWTLADVFRIFPRLEERQRQSGGTLSGGEQQMLAVGRALMTGPRLLLLDEPSEGLAPLIVREIGRVLATLKQAGLSILLVEQNVPLALRVADRVYVMSKGQIVYHGPPADLDADEDVKQRYLGIS
jgi:branched-chain amino acid transport system ATP-binding protein